MGLSIESKNCAIDIGYGGFKELRTKVAELTAPDIFEHYVYLNDGMFKMGKDREVFFEKYNKKITELNKKHNGEKSDILDFLYAPDCNWEMDAQHCKAIYTIIKDYDDDIRYGYSGRTDCAMFKDFKKLIKDGMDTGEGIYWS